MAMLVPEGEVRSGARNNIDAVSSLLERWRDGDPVKSCDIPREGMIKKVSTKT